jgi:hypothetical protein
VVVLVVLEELIQSLMVQLPFIMLVEVEVVQDMIVAILQQCLVEVLVVKVVEETGGATK